MTSDIYEYVSQHLPEALRRVQTGGYATAHPALTPAEKALVYHYTATGSTAINHSLHTQPGLLTSSSQGLLQAAQKLPVYRGVVYSAAHLAPLDLARLRQAAATGDTLATAGTIHWPAFLSASRSVRIAKNHLNLPDATAPKNCLFAISFRTGRSIEQLSYYGPNGHDPLDSEEEILFLPATRFAVVGANFETNWPRIELLEQ